MNYMKAEKALKAMEELNSEECHYVIQRLMEQEKVNIPGLIAVYANHLQQFKHDAIEDMRKLAESGLMLGEHEIKRLEKMKAMPRKKRNFELFTAMAHTLLQYGYVGTKFHEELSAHVDMSVVDKKWYDWAWGLKTRKSNNEHTEG